MSDTKRIVSVAPESLFTENKGSFVNLRHPRYDDAALFYLRNDLTLWEMQKHTDKYRSWFIGNTVKSDGSLYLITPFDPLFIAIRYLKQKNRFSTLDTVLEDSEFPEVKQIIDSESLAKRLEQIAEVKTSSGFKAFRFSESKTLDWLQRRFHKVEKALDDSGINCHEEGVSQASCWKSEDTSSPEAVRQYAAGILAEYLPEDLEDKLRERLGLDTEEKKANGSAEKQEHDENGVSENGAPTAKKRRSVAPVAPTNDYQETMKQLVDVKKEAAEKAAAAKPKLKKQPGMQSITNFFQKK